ncbi:hypothetical protein TraAM80_03224 [Trypanosoma rangeli]|uniref:Uncharacterized protein n=1 Tax=Trypanosoma rangeli TaxID=5698 RepID=A0A3R7KQF4_TRYRA|nr:uncharacterized protein TraAM80_03224 [Trypanosoma rangeli]RNF07627.1 hypothetical protein TraAM80_03224 [Trypanosoma rangeli]|eukprot:RNF07627.1 hypothetical protein TraAM80_03224 [Trypanosoma rangeli]
MQISSLLGTKRLREDQSLCERSVACRVTALLRCRVPCVVERDTTVRSASLSVSRYSVCPVVDKGGFFLSGASVSSSGPVLSPAESRSLGSKDNVCQLLTVIASSQDASTASPPHGQVEVDVTRGDTGRHYRFMFYVPIPDPPGSAGKETTTNVAYRNAVLRALLNQVSVEAALAVNRAWVVVYHGKNVLSGPGAELLMSALLSESRQRISLALFYGVVTG